MSEGIFQVVQLGRQSSVGTAVAATTVFPVDTGFLGFNLDRAPMSPDEDFGSPSREISGRESYGARWATASLPFVARYQDFMHALEMHVAAISGGTPTGGGTPYTYAYTYDETTNLFSSSVKPYTLEYGVPGSTQDEWRAYGVVADTLDLSFDSLSVPGNMPLKGTLGLVALGRDRNSMTGSLSAPSVLETIEGHSAVLTEGAVGTAFASLGTATASLKQWHMNSSQHAVGRVYGSSSDVATSIGRSGKGEVTFDALLAINSTTKADVDDIFEVSGSLPTERRWRITFTGTGSNSLTIDSRVRFRVVDRQDHEGEMLYAVQGVFVKDTTLGGRATFTLKNTVSTIP